MAEVLEGAISAETMRNAIRAKLRAGATKQAVCWLVCTFAPIDTDHHRTEGTVPRLPVEAIPADKREGFLSALTDLREFVVERRNSERHPALSPAQIIFANGRSSMNGQILDFSETGAMVRPAEPALCPDRFTLQPPFGATQECEVVWRKGDRIGVRYVKPLAR